MTKEDFIKLYCEKSNTTWETLSKRMVCLPCDCGDDLCKGWAMVTNEPDLIERHLEAYVGQKL